MANSVSFSTAAESAANFTSSAVQLSGTWRVPNAERPRAAVLLIPGSGPVDRNSDHKKMPLSVTRYLAESLSQSGVASLRYDKRGVGASGGSFLEAGLSDNLADAMAAFDWMSRAAPDAPLFVLGHSEGAYHAMSLAASEYGRRLAGVVLVSASAHTGFETGRWQTAQIKDALPAFPRFVLKVLRTDLVKQQAKSVEKIRRTTKDVVRMQGRRMNAKWMREFLDLDPQPLLRRLDMPVLAVTGSKDLQVNPADLEVIAREVPGEVTVRLIPDLTHLLRCDPGRPSLTDYKRQVCEPVDPEVLDAVTQWVGAHARPAAGEA